MRASGWAMAGLVGFGLVMMGTTAGAVDERTRVIQAGALDGKVFVGKIGKQGKTKWDRDSFEFRQGTFHSTSCDPYGFQAASYETAVGTEEVRFTSETHSPNEGRMVWKGSVRGPSFEGTALWYRKNGQAPESYWFKGQLKS